MSVLWYTKVVRNTEGGREQTMLATETKHYSTTNDGKAHWFTFDNWEEYIKLADTGETTMETRKKSSRSTGRPDWYGASFKESLRLARTGWAEGTRLLADAVWDFENMIPAKRLTTVTAMDITGPGVLDFGRWATGHPEAWMIQQEQETTEVGAGKVIRVVYNIGTSNNISTAEMMRKGATVAGLIDLLERSGRRVELDLVTMCRGHYGDHTIQTSVRVKNAGASLDIERIAYAIAHPSSFRRLTFAIWELAPPEARRACGISKGEGYGQPWDWTVEDAIYIPASNSMDHRDSTQRIAWVKEQLKAQGVTFED